MAWPFKCRDKTLGKIRLTMPIALGRIIAEICNKMRQASTWYNKQHIDLYLFYENL